MTIEAREIPPIELGAVTREDIPKTPPTCLPYHPRLFGLGLPKKRYGGIVGGKYRFNPDTQIYEPRKRKYERR